jgi:hypothetical protein
MSEYKGDLRVCRSINARRVNQGLNTDTITGAEQLDLHSAHWQELTAVATQDVILPDATGLPLGWEVVVKANTSTLNVKTYDAVTPVLRKAVEAGKAYKFTLLTNGAAAGTWHANQLEEADLIATARHVETFDATTDWGVAAGGIYTQTITQATHTRGTNPQVDLFEESGSDFVAVEASVKVLANGDIEITVPENPDCRFAGKAVII